MGLSIDRKPKDTEIGRTESMKEKALTFTLVIAILISISLTAFTRNVKAENNDYTIEEVNHIITIMNDGYMFINDTIRINGSVSGFLIGFPYNYGIHVVRCVAYNTTADFQVSLNVPLEDHVGFYGVRINFSQGTPQVFSVGFLLSNSLLTQNPSNASQYILDFPKYPSLTKDVKSCSVSILLPEQSTYMGGTVDLAYQQEDLPAFTGLTAKVAFLSTDDAIQIVDIEELEREIRISGTGEVECSDTYRITNQASNEIGSIEIILPQNASRVSAHDQLGRKLEIGETEQADGYKVTFASPLRIEGSDVFTVRYYLPSEGYIEQGGPKSFDFRFLLFQHLNYYVNRSSVTFVLPEGAKMLSFEKDSFGGSYSVARDVFQERLTVNRQGVLWLDSFIVEIEYEYDLLWLSFRPTLWMWALVVVGCAVAVVWRRRKVPIPVTVSRVAVRLGSKDIKSFVDLYAKKRKVLLDIESLKTRAQKGKIPRRRYKVRRRTLEARLNVLSRNLTDLKEKLSGARRQYGDLMRRLEVVETEISEVEANIESIEARHRRGELSLGAYRKLRADYERRKEKAETVVNEILIGLREEIH